MQPLFYMILTFRFPSAKRSCFPSIALAWVLFSPAVCYSADPSNGAAEAFKAFVVGRQAVLPKLTSFEMKANLKITSGLKENAPEITNFNIYVVAKGDKFKEVDETLDGKGNIENTQTYYLSPKKVVDLNKGAGQSHAKIFTLGKEPQFGCFNSPAFLEYGFLNRSIGLYGIPALLPSAIASKDKWNEMVQNTREITFVKGGTLRARLMGNTGSSTVDLIKLTGSNAGYRVGSISFFEDGGKNLDRTIEVLDYFHDQSIGEVGKAFRMSLFHGSDPKSPSHVWEFSVTEIKINCPVEADAVEFDPASADSIYDDDNKTFIDVPK